MPLFIADKNRRATVSEISFLLPVSLPLSEHEFSFRTLKHFIMGSDSIKACAIFLLFDVPWIICDSWISPFLYGIKDGWFNGSLPSLCCQSGTMGRDNLIGAGENLLSLPRVEINGIGRLEYTDALWEEGAGHDTEINHFH